MAPEGAPRGARAEAALSTLALPALDRFLTYRLHLLSKLSDRHTAEAYASELDLPLGEARCLAAIGSFAPLSVNDLAARANLNKGQASRAAQALVDRGHVHKLASTVDSRGVVLTLTESGERRFTQLMGIIASRNDAIFGCLNTAEQQVLGSLLDRLIQHVRMGVPNSASPGV